MALHFLVAITHGRIEDVVSSFQARTHLLDDLTAVLLALKLTLGGEHRFHELAFRRLFEVEVQTLTPRAAPLHFLA
ncbi:MAG: hypothetical protein AAFX52_11965 [Pseudomonadota bacterium]